MAQKRSRIDKKGEEMNTTITVSEQVAHHLNNLAVDNADDADSKLKGLLEAEYRRRLARYTLTDQQLSNKYSMDFASFEQNQITKRRNYSWEVESDAIAWETAVDGIATVERQIAELERGDSRRDII